MRIQRVCAFRLAFALFFCLLLTGKVFAQGGSLSSGGILVLSSTGRPLAGATVTICAFGATGIPCSPTITVYTSPALSITASNPATSDGNGNVFVYAAPGRYTYTVTGFGVVGTSYTATVAGSGGGDVLSSGNNILTGNNTLSGNNTINASSLTVSGTGTLTGALNATGGGSLGGVFTGAPVSTIASSPSGATESGSTATITTTATCTFVTNQAVTISGVGVSGYNGQWVVLSPGCNGGSSFTYTNTVSGLGSSGSGTVTGSPILSSGYTSTGPGVSTGPITLFPPSTFANTQMSQGFRTIINGCDPVAEFHYSNGNTNFATESDTACVAVPNTSTVRQANGYLGMINTSSASTNAVGGFFAARNLVTNGQIWGLNTVTSSTVGNPTNGMVGYEIDMNAYNATDAGEALLITGSWSVDTPNLDAIQVVQPQSSAGWKNLIDVLSPTFGNVTLRNGIRFRPGATNVVSGAAAALYFDAQGTGTNQPSQGIAFVSNDPVSGNNVATLNETAAGDLLLQNSKSGTGLIIPTLKPSTVGSTDIGNTALPFSNLWLGTAATNNFQLHPGTTTAARVVNLIDPGANSNLGMNFNNTTGTYMSKRAVSGCTTAASIGGICASAITVTWPGTFPDTNYSAGCSPSGAPTNLPSTPYIVSKANGSMTVNYFAITAAAASWVTIDCWAVHD